MPNFRSLFTQSIFWFSLISVTLMGCKSEPYARELGVVSGFSELVNAGVKRLALSSPLKPGEMDSFIIEAEKEAAKYNVSIYRESDLITTDLFPEDIAKGFDVLLLFRGTVKDEYLTLKTDKEELVKAGKYEGKARREIARRFGRLLSYSPRKINELISQNTPYRTMDDFGINATNLFLYYKDLEKAGDFYQNTLGFELLADYEMALIFRMTADSYLILVDATKGMHTADEPKTVALALLTEQLDEWYDYLKAQNVPIKYDYKPKDGGAHDGFVMIDPEGYLLEFERFKQHWENEKFIPQLKLNQPIIDQTNPNRRVPEGLGFHSTITWLYYKDVLEMQHFYENVMGLELVADQGWTKIYQASQTGFMGLVDERRGMHDFTEEKAVNVSFILNDLEGWFDYAKTNKPFELRSEELEMGPENKYKAFVGYDPEGYFMEFDAFFPHPDNDKLMEYLSRD